MNLVIDSLIILAFLIISTRVSSTGSNLNDITVPGNTWGSQSSWSGQTHSAYECPDGEYICGIDIDYYCYNCVDRLRLKCCSL